MVVEGLLQSITERTAKNGKTFHEFVISYKDKINNLTQIKAYYWDGQDSVIKLPLGSVFFFALEDGDFPKLLTVKPSSALSTDFIPNYYPSAAEAKRILLSYITRVEDPQCVAILNKVFTDELIERYIICPAAKGQHHAKLGGLLKHCVEVCDNALGLASNPSYAGVVDKDLLIAAALLHDIGKLDDYVISSSGAISYNKAIYITSHLSSGAEKLAELGINSPKGEHIKHIIHSHHGPTSLNWGSVCNPATLEAVMIFVSDYTSMVYDKQMAAAYDECGIGTSSLYRDVFVTF